MDINFDFSGKSILIVEDDNVSRMFYHEILKNSGANVAFVKSGYDTYQYFTDHSLPDIILMDIRLPDVNGLEITRKLLTDHPNLTIIAQTAFANSNMEDECMNVGMKGFLTKPINRDSVLKLLHKFLK